MKNKQLLRLQYLLYYFTALELKWRTDEGSSSSCIKGVKTLLCKGWSEKKWAPLVVFLLKCSWNWKML